MKKVNIQALKNDPTIALGILPLNGVDIMDSPFKDLASGLLLRGANVYQEDGVYYVYGPVNSLDLGADLSVLGTVISAGGFIKGLPLGCEMLKTKLTELTPAGIPSSIKEDESQMTWQEWFDAQGSSVVPSESLDGTKLAFQLSDHGRLWNSNEFVILIQVGYTVLTGKQFRTLIKSLDYVKEE